MKLRLAMPMNFILICSAAVALLAPPAQAKSPECELAETNKHNVCSQVLIETGELATQWVKKIKADPYNKRDLALEGRKKLQAMADKFAPECQKQINECTKQCKPEDKAYCDSKAKDKHIYLEFAARFVLFEGGESDTKEEDKKALAPSVELNDFLGQMNWVVQNFRVGGVSTSDVRSAVGLDAGAPPPRVYGPAEPPRSGNRERPRDTATGEIKTSDLAKLATAALQAQPPVQARPPSIPALVPADDPRLRNPDIRPIATELNRGSGNLGPDPKLDEVLQGISGAGADPNPMAGLSTSEELKKLSSALKGFESSGGAGLKPSQSGELTAKKKEAGGSNASSSPGDDPGGGFLNVGSGLPGAAAAKLGARTKEGTLGRGIGIGDRGTKPEGNGPNWNSILGSMSQFRANHKKTRGTASSLEHGIAGPHESIWLNASRAYINYGHRQSFLSLSP